MNKHSWNIVHNGIGIECDKCDAYANMMTDENFFEIEKRGDCPKAELSYEDFLTEYNKKRR